MNTQRKYRRTKEDRLIEIMFSPNWSAASTAADDLVSMILAEDESQNRIMEIWSRSNFHFKNSVAFYATDQELLTLAEILVKGDEREDDDILNGIANNKHCSASTLQSIREKAKRLGFILEIFSERGSY